MSNQSSGIGLIKSLTGQANILTIPRVYVDFMGSLDGGLFLSQVIYWSDKTKNPEGWFYKTYDEWKDEICLSKYEVGKQAKTLKEAGLLETKIKKANGFPTVHYKFSFDEFEKTFVKFLNNGKSRNLTNESKETSRTITYTTTETTTETTLNPKGLSVFQPITDEQPNLSPIKEKSSSQKTVSPARPKTQIKDKFIDLTGMSMPKVKNQQDYWWSQFGEILHIAKDDPGDACDALCQVVSYMQKENLCISGPQSVVGLCRAVIAGQKLNGGTNEKTSRHSQSNGRPDGHSLGTIAFNPKTGETVHVG